METDDYQMDIEDDEEPSFEASTNAGEAAAPEELPAPEKSADSEEPGEVDPTLADWFKVDEKPSAKPVDSDTASENDSENEDFKEENEDDDWLNLTLSGESVDSEVVAEKVSHCVFRIGCNICILDSLFLSG
jgi:hypothetical protein